MKATVLSILLLLFGVCSVVRCGESAQFTATMPEQTDVFGKAELEVKFPPDVTEWLRTLPDTQIHDAYDADRDGVYVRLSADFTVDEHTVTVPGFAMRPSANTPWSWRIRFSPRRAGFHSVKLRLEYRKGKESAPVVLEQALERTLRAVALKNFAGPLVMPDADGQPPLLRELTPGGTSQAKWLFGACRAWVVDTQDPANEWPDEFIDRETELFPVMRVSGYNLLNQWMAPWEFLLVHHDRAEFWKDAHDKFQRVPLPKENGWTPYQCFDQGRAAAFDRLITQCEGNDERPLIYLLLSPLPHQCFQMSEHPWAKQASGWSPENDTGGQSGERLNGFSAFKASGKGTPEKLSAWNFFEADPAQPADDWRSQLFDHEANYYRYLIARWSYSRAVGVWVLIDEIDGIGDEVGNRRLQFGWWGHPECEHWLANVVRLFHGTLKNKEGQAYGGDPFAHPLHASATSARGQAERGGNIDWDGGPADARPDLMGFHWYPNWGRDVTWSDVWDYTTSGVVSYAQAPLGKSPRLISEFGAQDRNKPADEPSYLYPTLYHHAIWAAIFTGQAGTPMDWDDGKEYGELAPRERKGMFDKEHYPIDNPAQLRALRKFLETVSPDRLRSCQTDDATIHCSSNDDTRAYALYDTDGTTAYGWVFTPTNKAQFTFTGLKPGMYAMTWYDPWTGLPFDDSELYKIDKKERIRIDASDALKTLRKRSDSFPKHSRLSQGQDVAFRLKALVNE